MEMLQACLACHQDMHRLLTAFCTAPLACASGCRACAAGGAAASACKRESSTDCPAMHARCPCASLRPLTVSRSHGVLAQTLLYLLSAYRLLASSSVPPLGAKCRTSRGFTCPTRRAPVLSPSHHHVSSTRPAGPALVSLQTEVQSAAGPQAAWLWRAGPAGAAAGWPPGIC